jgi:DNA transformation protein and related proteins
MTDKKQVRDDALRRLSHIGPVSARALFGGFGLYLDGVMFGLIAQGAVYFRVDDRNRQDYVAAGAAPFTYGSKGKPIEMPYWRVPPTIWDDMAPLAGWAMAAHEAARRARAAKTGKTRRR